jgi:hypothetical protein
MRRFASRLTHRSAAPSRVRQGVPVPGSPARCAVKYSAASNAAPAAHSPTPPGGFVSA